jgi:hypothetical protein
MHTYVDHDSGTGLFDAISEPLQSPNMASINGALFTRSSSAIVSGFTLEQRRAIIDVIWPYHDLAQQEAVEDYAAWFSSMRRTLQGLHRHAAAFATQDWEGMRAIIIHLGAHRDLEKKALIEIIKVDYIN